MFNKYGNYTRTMAEPDTIAKVTVYGCDWMNPCRFDQIGNLILK